MLTPGHRLDRYELLCPIASGGMATVWLARLRGKRGFEKLVAIKTIKTELITDPAYAAMFLDEARIASGIQHPNVAQILDLGEQDDSLYLVMEWVDGDSLAKVHRLAAKKGRALPIELGLRIMADACAGLHAAHELKDARGKPLGVVHRDVSPQNVLVTKNGAAKVIDFGLAKAEHRDAPDTQAGVVKGKIRYLAPEYARGKGTDRRADVWAAGICLYELVTGKTPYDELGDLDVVRHLMGPDPGPKLAGEDMPAPIRSVLERALAVDPEARFPTAAAMRRAIEAALGELGKSPTTDDVAEFVSAVLPELAERRSRTVTKVMASARPTPSLVPDAPVPSPIVVVPPPPASSQAVELVRRKEPAEARDADESASMPAATLSEQVGGRPAPRIGTYFFLAVVGVAAFAAFIYPGRERVRALFDAPPPAAAVASATPEATPPPPPPVPAPPETSVAPAASAEPAAAIDVEPPAPRALAPRAAPIAEPETTPDASRPKWDYRPDGWKEEAAEPSPSASHALPPLEPAIDAAP